MRNPPSTGCPADRGLPMHPSLQAAVLTAALAPTVLVPGVHPGCARHPIPPEPRRAAAVAYRKRTADPRSAELLARMGRQARALLLTLDELDAYLGGGLASLSPDECDYLGRRLAAIAASGLRVLEHDLEADLGEAVTRARRGRASPE